MDNNISDIQSNDENVVQVVAEEKKIREFTTHDSAFAWFSYIASYLFCLVFPVSGTPFGGMLFIIALFLFAFIFLKIKGHKIPVTSSLAGVSAVALSASLVLSSNSFIHFFAYVYCLGAFCYFVYTAMGNTIRKGFSNYLIADWAEAILISPFSSLKKPQMAHAMFSGKRKGSLNVIKKLAVGLVVAVVPTSIAFALLSYDENFTELAGNIFTFNEIDVLKHIFCLLFAIPLGMFMFSLYLSSDDKKVSGKFSEEKIGRLAEKTKIASLTTVIAAALPLLAVYVLFFVSQWQYYVSAFTNVLPENFSYAEYAREGFFQLCAVSVINLAVIAMIILFTKKSKGSSVVLKILSVVFSVFTLVLISTAIAKLVMYIDIYGLTQKRFYAAWFMLVLALIFVAVAVSRFVPKISILTVSAAILVVSFTGLALCNADSLIAKYNVDMYISGEHENIDIYAMASLGEASTSELVRLAEYIDEKEGTNIIERVKSEDMSYDEAIYNFDTGDYENSNIHNGLKDWLVARKTVVERSKTAFFSFTFNRMREETALREAGIIK